MSASKGFGAESLNDGPVSFSRNRNAASKPALSSGEFLRQSCASMKIAIGPRNHEDCPHGVTAQRYAPADSASLDAAINAAYRQVYGNAHVMDNERSVELEAQFCNGELNVRDFVRGLAKSNFYRARFFEGVAPQRGIELNLKHLLGRPPINQAEMSAHITLLASGGHDAVIDFIVDGAEYAEVFGDDVVPYTRSFTSAAGIPTNSFANMAALERGFALSDSAIGSRSQLSNNLARGTTAYIQLPSGFRSGVSPSSPSGAMAFAPKKRASSDGGDFAPIRNDAYVGFGLGQREQEVFQRCPGDTADTINGLIRATYRQVMGNPHLMESERAMSAESKFAEGYLSTRELVRAIALSPEYSRRFFETNAPYRFVELNFKHLLGRAPTSQAELSEHIQILANDGYEAEINSYLDSTEYQSTFGEDTVPYLRILSEQGRSQLAFNRHLSLAEGYAASDTVLNSSSLVTSVATNSVPSGWRTTTTRTNRNGAVAGSPSATTKRFRIVVNAQPRGGRQRTPNASYLVSGKDMTSQLKYIHARGGRIVSITEVM
ncbi:phycobilisome rod-core linker polypeptide [Synechococcus sp. CS-197]|uniref:phycobilisome rod-core linker polypeptide n=1 Tax=Synechococcus sp. CS-197 TaxID=2847985 RepID=UPI0001525258|nr:phycobilisome rod-core linker polypeptide [Synechococcus sp. CS-197]MCT0250086.1 phycobilisome rod-core linker polypeptide [Synechococcus sp. CS-197]CAK22928.1 Phycobilisome linker polypeptide, C-phycoerythrin-associated [Synechococcus sp. WH 7803]